ncbi:MAG TPA: DUF423 domain-containing protein [Cyclobacteriaceae bacterium]|jgi:uncharacterized membrane protein YgdD (TMEM256/DUF423 family)
MQLRATLIFGSLSGMLAVMLGAFGAHGLKDQLLSTGRLESFNLAVEYQFYHSLALLLTGILMRLGATGQLSAAALGFAAGIVIFSGSLYSLSIFDVSWPGAITPIGGICFIAGWLALTLHFVKKIRPQ